MNIIFSMFSLRFLYVPLNIFVTIYVQPTDLDVLYVRTYSCLLRF